MMYDEYKECIGPIRDKWPGKFTDAEAERLWRRVSKLPLTALQTAVDDMIDSRTFVPTVMMVAKRAYEKKEAAAAAAPAARKGGHKPGEWVEVHEQYAAKEENGKFYDRVGTEEQYRLSSACCKGMVSEAYADRVKAIDVFLAGAERIGWPVDKRPYLIRRDYYGHKAGKVPAGALFADGETPIPF